MLPPPPDKSKPTWISSGNTPGKNPPEGHRRSFSSLVSGTPWGGIFPATASVRNLSVRRHDRGQQFRGERRTGRERKCRRRKFRKPTPPGEKCQGSSGKPPTKKCRRILSTAPRRHVPNSPAAHQPFHERHPAIPKTITHSLLPHPKFSANARFIWLVTCAPFTPFPASSSPPPSLTSTQFPSRFPLPLCFWFLPLYCSSCSPPPLPAFRPSHPPFFES